MNRDCFGTFFPALNKYRCLLDGTFINTQSPPERCPACGRLTANVMIENEDRQRTITTKQVMMDGRWVDLSETVS